MASQTTTTTTTAARRCIRLDLEAEEDQIKKNHHSMNNIMTPSPPQASYRVPPNQRSIYGMHGLVVLASSHPLSAACLCADSTSTFPTTKNLHALGLGSTDLEDQFIAIYDTVLHHQIVSAIENTLPDCDWGLHAVRLGFEVERCKNPITIQLVIATSDNQGGRAGGGHFLLLSEEHQDNAACKIVLDIYSILTAVVGGGGGDLSEVKSIHVDVCRTQERCTFAHSDAFDPSFSLCERNPGIYDSAAVRLPYSSIGPVEPRSVGVITGYIQHRDENGKTTRYALTNRHVVDPYNTLSPGELSKRQVTCPARVDHDTTIQNLADRINLLQSGPDISRLQQTLDNAKQYNIDFGHVHATSSRYRLLPESESRSDWAIISITNPDILPENKHVRSSPGSSFYSFDHPRYDPLTIEFLRNAKQYFDPGPSFKAPRQKDLGLDELVFKPRSRTTKDWVGGRVNGIRSTQKIQGIKTRELCLVALTQHGVISAQGDSGSLILDQEFQPVAILWGGDLHGFAHGPRDVSYVSPLTKVLRDIELSMGWKEGSAQML